MSCYGEFVRNVNVRIVEFIITNQKPNKHLPVQKQQRKH